MQTLRNTMAVVAAGLASLMGGSADAGVSFSINLGGGGHRRPEPVVHRVVTPVVQPRVVVTQPVVPVVRQVRTVVQPAVPVTVLPNSQTVANLAGTAGLGRYFKIIVPPGQTYLSVLTDGGLGDADLYVAQGFLPTPSQYQYASTGPETSEEVSILQPTPGAWYILLNGARSYGGVSLLASWWQQELYQEQTSYQTQTPAPDTQVVITWGRPGHGRPAGGLIPFILGQIRDRHGFRHTIRCGHDRHAPPAPRVISRIPAPAGRRPGAVTRTTTTTTRVGVGRSLPRRPQAVSRTTTVRTAPGHVARPGVAAGVQVLGSLLNGALGGGRHR